MFCVCFGTNVLVWPQTKSILFIFEIVFLRSAVNVLLLCKCHLFPPTVLWKQCNCDIAVFFASASEGAGGKVAPCSLRPAQKENVNNTGKQQSANSFQGKSDFRWVLKGVSVSGQVQAVVTQHTSFGLYMVEQRLRVLASCLCFTVKCEKNWTLNYGNIFNSWTVGSLS